MGKLAKEFADIINEQDFCFDPYEMKVIRLAIRAINEWEEQNKGCFGCLHLGDKNTNVNRVQDLAMLIIMFLMVKNRTLKGENICIKFYYY